MGNVYVKMSEGYLQIQHTPKPEAQLPPLVPPLVEHSSLKIL